MVNLTIEERKEMIMQLAERDIRAILNVNFNSVVVLGENENLIVHGNTLINTNTETPSIEMTNEDSEFVVPSDTSKYEITKTKYGIRWKLKNQDEN